MLDQKMICTLIALYGKSRKNTDFLFPMPSFIAEHTEESPALILDGVFLHKADEASQPAKALLYDQQ